MIDLLRGAWAGLDNTGRIALIVCVAIVIVASIAYGFDVGALLK